MAQRYSTVVTLNNVDLPAGTTINFGDGILFGDVPEWVHSDRWLQRLGENRRNLILDSRHAFITEYDCNSLGEVDSRWKGTVAKSKQKVKYELIGLANLALWLSLPTSACMGTVFNCPDEGAGGWVIQQSISPFVLMCHPDDAKSRLDVADVKQAASLHRPLVEMHLTQAMWSPALIALSFLQMNSELVRYLLCWVGLESLFGPEDPREITFRLAQRIGFFLEADRAAARKVYETTKAGYSLRSKLAHGSWKYDSKTTERMRDGEDLIRRSLKKILADPGLLKTFSGKKREEYLDLLAFG